MSALNPNNHWRFVAILTASVTVHGLVLLWQINRHTPATLNVTTPLQLRLTHDRSVSESATSDSPVIGVNAKQHQHSDTASAPGTAVNNKQAATAHTGPSIRPKAPAAPTPRKAENHTQSTNRAMPARGESLTAQKSSPGLQAPVNAASANPATQPLSALSEAERHARVQHALQQALVFKRYYPPLAIRRGWQGRVQLGLTVQPDGQLTAVRVIQTSGYAMLDRAALRSIDQVGQLPEAGRWLVKPLDMIIPVRYQLNDQEA